LGSKWRYNRWYLGLNQEERNVLYARLLGFDFPFYLRSGDPDTGVYTIGHLTVQPTEVSDLPLEFVVDGTFFAPGSPPYSFPYGRDVESDEM
jgi:hypothetical protein